MLIGDPEVEIQPRFIMTVNSGDVVQFPIIQEENCPFCIEMATIRQSNTELRQTSDEN